MGKIIKETSNFLINVSDAYKNVENVSRNGVECNE